MASNVAAIPDEMKNAVEQSLFAFAAFRLVDGEYEAVLVSDGMCRLFGMEREKLVLYLTNKSYGLMHPDDAGKLIEASKGLATKDEITVICRLKRNDSYHPILFREYPYHTAWGETLYVVSYTDLVDAGAGSEDAYNEYLDRQHERLYVDAVTDLPNINYYQTFAKGTLAECFARGEYPTLLFFDIQGMHYFNDRYGYEKGDALLKETGQILRAAYGNRFCVRYAEDHFVIITGETDFIEKLDEAREKLRAYIDDGTIDLKAGIYTCEDPREDAVTALDKARRACAFVADKSDTYLCEYSGDVLKKDRLKNYVLSHCRKAMEEGWIRAYYQPLINGVNGKIGHAEALARWIDPVYGFMSPADFIPVLETSHRIWEVDLYILECVCRDMRACRDKGLPYAYTSVNLSRHDLDIPDIHERINAILAKYDIPRGEVAIEITESALAEHEQMIAAHIDHFHRDGYKVWLDDFGSGYSSFNALQDFDFDFLKIDMQFLRHQNARTPDILSDIVDLAKKLGMGTVTEGVETEEQARFLQKIGCGLLQGFYFSKPIPGDAVYETIEELGLSVEPIEDRAFYSNLMKVNVLDLDHPMPDSSYENIGGDRSLTIVTVENGKMRFIYTTEVGKGWMSEVGAPTLDEMSDRANNDPMPVHKTMWSCFEKLHEVGETVSSPVDDPMLKGSIDVELIAKAGDRRGYMIYCFRGRE